MGSIPTLLLLDVVAFETMGRKYELETIPIWDAFDADTECALCLLDERAEKRLVQFFLGNSVMVPETRVEVNSTGFCRVHFRLLWEGESNRHSLGLIAHTHLKDVIKGANAHQRRVRSKHRRGSRTLVRGYISYLRRREDSCMICDRLRTTLDRYAFTVVYLWNRKQEFREAVEQSKGFCYRHLQHVLEMARNELPRSRFAMFAALLARLQEEAMSRVEGELHWFTQKFDYQNDTKPWGTSKDALGRALQKLCGAIFQDPTS